MVNNEHIENYDNDNDDDHDDALTSSKPYEQLMLRECMEGLVAFLRISQ